MATKVHMEALSPTMEEGQIVKWVKSEGDEVSNGDILAEIETDKATMELVARGVGVLRAILLEEGETAPVGAVIGVIGEADEDIDDIVAEAGGGTSAGTGDDTEDGEEDGGGGDEGSADDAAESGATEDEGSPEGAEAEKDRAGDASGAAADDAEPSDSRPVRKTEASDGGRIKASPLARRLAEEAGIDLSAVSGSGPGGRIVKADVEEAASAPPEKSERPAAAAPEAPRGKEARPTPPPEDWSDAGATESHEDVKVSQMRKTIARRLTESLSPVPHFFLTIEVDMARVMEARKSVNAAVEADGDRVSVNDFVIRATAAALKKHPACNAAWHDDVIRRFDHVHVGVAVAVEDGLITPVIRHADRKGLVQISREVKEMAGRAREKKLQPDEYTGATFSISNLGMFGIHEFTAIINPPEAGILAVGAVEEVPVAVDGELVVRPRMRVTMSCDHRVIDGATGAKFLQTLRTMLEEPAAILI